MIAIGESGNKFKAPRLSLTTIIDIKRFIRAIKRRENDSENSDLNKIYKDLDSIIDILKDYRVENNIK